MHGGYAHHDARFVHFSFLTPDGELRVVDGKRLELAPRDLWNFGVAYSPSLGPGAVAPNFRKRNSITIAAIVRAKTHAIMMGWCCMNSANRFIGA